MSQRTTSFVTPARLPLRVVAIALWLAAAIMAAWAAYDLYEARRISADADRLSLRINDLAAQEGANSGQDRAAPEAAAINALADDIDFFNTLTGQRPAPLSLVLEGLETLLPPDVLVSQLVWSAETARLKLALQATDEAALPAALSALETAPFLNSVILERQTRVRKGQRSLVQYDIEAGLN